MLAETTKFLVGKLHKTDLLIIGVEILIILIYCLTYAALRRFSAVAVHQTLAKAEKQKWYRVMKCEIKLNTHK